MLHLALALLLTVPTAQDEDLTDRLRSKDGAERAAAVAELSASPTKDVEVRLLRALKDDDWEVRLEALRGLGQHGQKKALKPLKKAALEQPSRLLRRAAVEAYVELAGTEALLELIDETKGREIDRGASAVAHAARSLSETGPEGEVEWRRVEKLLTYEDDNDEEGDLRAYGATALTLADKRPERFDELLGSPDARIRLATLEAAALAPETFHGARVIAHLEKKRSDVETRRALTVLKALFDDEAVREQLGDLPDSRLGMFAVELFDARSEGDVRDWCELTFVQLRTSESTLARAFAAAGLERVGSEEAGGLLLELLTDDEARVRRRAARALGEGFEPGTHTAALAERLTTDGSGGVRLELAAQLGRRGQVAGLDALVGALSDPEWKIRVVAAVSLGKLSVPEALEPLVALYGDNPEDWRMRGAAVVGLSQLYLKEAFAPIVAAMEDTDPTVVRTAHEALRRLSRRLDVEPTLEAWTEAVLGARSVRLTHPLDDAASRDRYGYSVPDAEIYRGLDVVVLESRGDHIQDLLGELEIEHRLTVGSRVPQAAVHPDAIFISNCTGELAGQDPQRLSWFVLTGGNLFGSCWALTETIGRVAPGYIVRQRTRSEVLDQVEATAVAPDSPFLDGVVPPNVTPVYNLEGAHLIAVGAPTMVEVLIDSSEAAARWGEGNLAAWFRYGHGVVLDSVNHFDLQGLETAAGLEDDDDRMAYAVDHLGLALAKLRELTDPRVWRSNTRAAEVVPDRSAFRFLTNFVRAKRSGDLDRR